MNRVLIANTTSGDDVPSFAEPLPELSLEPVAQLDGHDGFFIATRRVLLTGTAGDGLHSIWLDRQHAVQDMRLLPLACLRCEQSPLGIERSLEGGVSERIIAAPDTPAVIVEWHSENDVEFDLAWSTDDTVPAVFAFGLPVDVTTTHTGTTARVTAHVKLAPAQPVRLLIAGDAALIKETAPGRWARAHAAAAQRRRAELMHVASNEAALAQRWAWAQHEIAMQMHRPQPSAQLVLALIVLGDFTNARRLLTPNLEPYFHAAVGDEPGALPPEPPDPDDVAWATLQESDALVTSFARNVLGYGPDAARGRLTLRPRLPAAWTQLLIENIPLGDARVRLSCEAGHEGCRFRITQTAGAYPVRLIFEPGLSFQPSRTVVDGVAAELKLHRSNERTIAPVQIMLDAERTIAFER